MTSDQDSKQLLKQFYEGVFKATFAESNIEMFPLETLEKALENDTDGRRLQIAVAIKDGEVVGGQAFQYLADLNAGFSGYRSGKESIDANTVYEKLEDFSHGLMKQEAERNGQSLFYVFDVVPDYYGNKEEAGKNIKSIAGASQWHIVDFPYVLPARKNDRPCTRPLLSAKLLKKMAKLL